MSYEKTPRILLVEDNPGDVRYIQALLEESVEFSHRTVTGAGGVLNETTEPPAEDAPTLVHESRLEAGLERVESGPVDVVLLDLNLPDSTGLDTLEAVRAAQPRLPIVVLTGMPDRDLGIEALRNGADEYLVKDDLNADLLTRSVYHTIERKANERELKQYEVLVEESTDATAVLDETAAFKYITPAAERILGYTQEELRGEVGFEFVHPEDRETVREEFERLLEDPDYRGAAECRFRHADGSWITLSARARNLLAEPDVEGVVVYSHDITERKKYERRLQEQRQRLGSLNRLGEVVHGVTESVIEQSTRDRIEQIACERLAAAPDYEFAWIGEVDPATGDVSLRVEAGVEGYLDGVAVTTDPDEPEGRGPVGRALRTGELQATPDVHGDPSCEPWRSAAEAYGFDSYAAIPIRHEDTVFGVLAVHAGTAEAFREEERAVIDHLGEILGYAIAAAQRKQALMSDAVVELEIGVPDAFADVDGAADVGVVEFRQVVPVDDGEFLLYGTAASEGVGAVERLAGEIPHWESVTALGEAPDGARFQLQLSEPPVLSAVAAIGGDIARAVVEDGDYRITVHLPQGADVRDVVERVRETHPDAEALARRQVSADERPTERLTDAWAEKLTDRQRTAVEVAYFSGFFEWPRGSSGEEVAESLGVSSPTFHQHVRAAEHKLLDALLENSASETR